LISTNLSEYSKSGKYEPYNVSILSGFVGSVKPSFRHFCKWKNFKPFQNIEIVINFIIIINIDVKIIPTQNPSIKHRFSEYDKFSFI